MPPEKRSLPEPAHEIVAVMDFILSRKGGRIPPFWRESLMLLPA
jgi:hypothetical protein